MLLAGDMWMVVNATVVVLKCILQFPAGLCVASHIQEPCVSLAYLS
jgi:hypothetical protein